MNPYNVLNLFKFTQYEQFLALKDVLNVTIK